MDTQTEKTELSFSLSGENFTRYIRDLTLEPNLTKAWKVFQQTFLDLDLSTLKEAFTLIIDGSMEFTGVNNLELIESDNCSLIEQFKENLLISKEIGHNDSSFFTRELKTLLFIGHLPKEERDEFFLDIVAGEFSDQEFAWITGNGKFIPVSYQGHIAMLDRIRKEDLVDEKYPIGENHWIKITTGNTIFCLGQKITDQQKNTLCNFLKFKKKDFFRFNSEIEIIGFGYAKLANNEVELIDLWGDDQDLDREKYLERPKGAVKRVDLERALVLYGYQVPLFTYIDGEYRRLKSCDFHYRGSREIYCQVSDLYGHF
jgi:hypothetical protein